MKVKFAAALLLGVSCWAQTSAELLQKGIYEQETAGNLDNAILIYRQIVNSAPSQRDVAAQAQYRLAQALLQKGNMAEASKEFDRLARDYADYSSLVSSLAGQVGPGIYRFNLVTAGGGPGPGTPELVAARKARLQELQVKLAELRTRYTEGHPEVVQTELQIQDLQKALERAVMGQTPEAPTFWHPDLSKPVTVQGKVTKVQWINPRAVVDVQVANGDGSNTLWGFQLGAPNALLKLGWTRATLKPGDSATVTGYLAQEDMGAADVKMAVPTGVTLADGRTFETATRHQ
jgi:tetratricopeptide (TPR) repeat protein